MNEGKEKLGEDIINMYKPYENKSTVWKKTKLNNQTFDLPDYYEVVSLSNYILEPSWSRSLWSSCCSYRS